MSKGDSPLKQFEIKPLVDLELFGIDISFTNSSLWMVITTILILAFFSLPFLKSNSKTNSIDDLYPSRIFFLSTELEADPVFDVFDAAEPLTTF